MIVIVQVFRPSADSRAGWHKEVLVFGDHSCIQPESSSSQTARTSARVPFHSHPQMAFDNRDRVKESICNPAANLAVGGNESFRQIMGAGSRVIF
jgi:hypothetical protein